MIVSKPGYVPNAGDLVWTDFDPIKGREQTGRRPALIISSAEFTEYTGLSVVCPVTSRVRPFPTSVVLPANLPITGEILVSHVRSIDIRARPLIYTGTSVDRHTAELVRAKLAVIVTI
jgi:mRNA interferase MazF